MKELMKREDVKPQYLWDMTAIFKDEAEWEAAIKFVKDAIPKIQAFNNKLVNEADILKCLRLCDEAEMPLEKSYIYTHASSDVNTADTVRLGAKQRAEALYFEYVGAVSFIAPQLTSLPLEKLQKMSEAPEFCDYSQMLSDIIKKKPHILTENEEKIMALAGEVGGCFEDVFSMINNIDVDFPVLNVDGEDMKLSHGRYSLLLSHKDESVRKAAFDGVYTAFKKLINTLAANLNGNIKKDVFNSKARKYNTCIESFMSAEDVPVSVYENLIKAVNENTKYVHDYVGLRKEILDKELHMYDLYVPIVEGAELKLEYEEAFDLVKKALKPLGEDYAELLNKSFTDGWIDVCETQNKRSGAYVTHTYGVHPYVLLNYTKTTHDVFTIAHELGHAMHSHYSMISQPFSKANYRIFVAEVASTVNEVLLLNYLLANTQDLTMKKYLISYYLDMFRTTLFRQTMFAQFEKETHEMVERGEPITQESLSNLYYELNKKYYGPHVEHDDMIRYEWARIPHFYYGFYVYKYATGLTAAVNIATSILSGEKGALERYKKFLSAGGSKSPYIILKDAGVDLATETPYVKAMKVFSDKVAELRELK